MALTSATGGCGCKIGPAELLGLLGPVASPADERLLVGAATADDAAVYRLAEDLALVTTVDFFPPPVDDPYDFGRIAAANALSDVYAMGGRPLTALNVVAYPADDAPLEHLGEILRGGAETCSRAGVHVAGGHSIRLGEPVFGLAVTGTVDPRALLTNAGGRAGDALVLTKPLGAGALAWAARRGAAGPAALAEAVGVMAALNDTASAAALAAGAHAVTDVTGFGLLGHLHHLARESGLAARVSAAEVPVVPGAAEVLADGRPVSGGGRRNMAWSAAFASFAPGARGWRARLLCDPTTSGGLLVAVDPGRAGEVPGPVVGELCEGPAGRVEVL